MKKIRIRCICCCCCTHIISSWRMTRYYNNNSSSAGHFYAKFGYTTLQIDILAFCDQFSFIRTALAFKTYTHTHTTQAEKERERESTLKQWIVLRTFGLLFLLFRSVWSIPKGKKRIKSTKPKIKQQQHWKKKKPATTDILAMCVRAFFCIRSFFGSTCVFTHSIPKCIRSTQTHTHTPQISSKDRHKAIDRNEWK